MTGAMQMGLSGLERGFSRLDGAADRIARDTEQAATAGNMVELLRARQDVRASLAVIRAAGELTGTLIDAFA